MIFNPKNIIIQDTNITYYISILFQIYISQLK
jgi:hypothetical protein